MYKLRKVVMGFRSVVVVISVTFISVVNAMMGVATLAKPNCQSQSGDVSIPYPFGIGGDCNINSKFSITCNTTFNPPRPLLGKFVLLNISLDGQLRILTEVTYDCYDRFGRSSYLKRSLTLDKFSINNTINKFTAIGCDTFALVRTFGGPSNYATGCLSTCSSTSDLVDGSCSGIGCCQASIPKEAWGYDISVNSFENHSKVLAENPCNYAFVAEDDNYTFSKSDLRGYVFQDRKFPVTLDWTIGNITCSESKKDTTKFACKENSKCIDSEIGGYLSKCFDGFEGNPYLSNGCQDINECELDPCVSISTCQNLPGSYNCSCPVGFEGDGRKDGTGCSPIKRSPFFYIALGTGIGFLGLLSILSLCLMLKRIQISKLRERYFQQNGGNFMREQLSRCQGYGENFKIFLAEELEKATKNLTNIES